MAGLLRERPHSVSSYVKPEGSRIEEPSLHEEPNPYDRPDLREAFDSGWHAFREDQPPPDECQFGGPEEIEAWLEGYLMAEDHEGR